MRAEPISPERLAERIAELVIEAGDAPTETPWTRLAVDGAPGSGTADVAAAVAALLVDAGRPVQRISAGDFLRPRSLRLEHGREDPDVFYTEWLDVKGLMREVFDPLTAGGSGRVLPSLWNAERDRASRAPYVELPPGGVLILEGALLFGVGLPFDVSVHLWLSKGALARRTPEDMAWTLPAYARYDVEVDPSRAASLTARMDDPRHPALLFL
ncbi:MAG: uridine kinase [Catenulispora sp.]|nr:uridine kinase [Catenulispora sp.]